MIATLRTCLIFAASAALAGCSVTTGQTSDPEAEAEPAAAAERSTEAGAAPSDGAPDPSGDGDRATAAECAEAWQRIADVSVAKLEVQLDGSQLDDAQRAKMMDDVRDQMAASGASFREGCVGKMTRAMIACFQGIEQLDELERCNGVE